MIRFAVATLAAVILVGGWAAAAPPKVSQSSPANGDGKVDPATNEIVVVFDQPMNQGGMSVVGGGEQFPEITGQPSWRNARTIVIPVALRPNHLYELSINSHRYGNFKNRSGESAVPYPIRFRTARGAGGATAPPSADLAADNAAAIEKLVAALTLQYSHRDRLGIDWAGLIAAERDSLAAAVSPREFAEKASLLLARGQDKHIWLEVDGDQLPAYVNPVTPNVNIELLPKIIPNWRPLNDLVAVGRWDDGIGYVAIHSWDRQRAEQLLAAFEAIWEMHEAPALVIDIRLNGGGDETLARKVAGCFVEQPAVYARRDRCDPDHPGHFTPAYDSVVEPNKQRPRYRGRLAVLVGPAVMSSCESFALMMRYAAGAALVGAATQGSSGNPQPHNLGNGVTAYLPSWREMTPDGAALEGVGLIPDVPVTTTQQDFVVRDPVVDAALERLRESTVDAGSDRDADAR